MSNKKKRYRKGAVFSKHLTFEKEMLPWIYDGGTKKRRRAFFKCRHHDDSFFEMNFDHAKDTEKNDVCPCLQVFRDHQLNQFSIPKTEVDDYNFIKKFNWLRKASKTTPSGWFKVTRTAIIVEGEPFYYFEEHNRKGVDYLIARQIEAVIWNRPKPNKSFYLMRLSHEYDAAHAEDKMYFKSDIWNRGAGREYFEELIYNKKK